MRRCGVPTIRNCDRGLSCARTVVFWDTAALSLSEPNVAVCPPGAVITPSRIVSCAGETPSWSAAASRSAPRAIAAATRTGV